MAAKHLQYWLGFVSFLSIFGAFNAFFLPHIIEQNQFPAIQGQLTPLAGRLFGCWTLVATFVRGSTAFDIANRSLYHTCLFTFLVALGIYVNETFVVGTATVKTAWPPFIVASVSIGWMLYEYPNIFGKKKDQ